MKLINIPLTVEKIAIDELSASDRELVDAATLATYRSYSPYSHFSVGAAIRLDDGTIVTGANQENVAYSSGTCAERTACYYAHTQYPERSFRAIAIAARGTDGELTSELIPPCGACRQALLEYEKIDGSPVRVMMRGGDFVYTVPSVASLLPLSFTSFS